MPKLKTSPKVSLQTVSFIGRFCRVDLSDHEIQLVEQLIAAMLTGDLDLVNQLLENSSSLVKFAPSSRDRKSVV